MPKVFWLWSCLWIVFLSYSAESLENRNIPWFIYGDSVYYIDTELIYTSKDAQKICLQKNMIFTITNTQRALQMLFSYITETYGYFPSFWTFKNELYNYMDPYRSNGNNSCYALSHPAMDFRKESCEEKMGILCKRTFDGANLFFVNGTRNTVRRMYDIKKYCNPHSTEFDDMLQLCLIHYLRPPK